VPGERGLDLAIFAYLGGSVPFDSTQTPQVSEGDDRGGFAPEVDHLVRLSTIRPLHAHAVHRKASGAPIPAFKSARRSRLLTKPEQLSVGI
jgi:hypothetical protein